MIEHRLPRGVYARDYPGAGPALVLMHGFPDHLGIYDDIVPLLAATGRRVVTFDYLGFGRSQKLPGAVYSFAQQLADLETVVETLALGKVVLVPHDSSGIVAIDFALAHPAQVAALHMLNSAFAEPADAVWPELITLFADPRLAALARAITQDPAQLGWLFPAKLAHNRTRLAEVAALDLPVRVIWGTRDQYLPAAMGIVRAQQFRDATFHPIDAGHWLQVDEAALVANALG